MFNFSVFCSVFSLGNNLVALGSLATAGTSEHPDNGEAGGGQSGAVNGLGGAYFRLKSVILWSGLSRQNSSPL